jgi:hypothetical protein
MPDPTPVPEANEKSGGIPMPSDEGEAWAYITGGLVFFLRAHTFKTLIALAVFFGGVVYVGFDYLDTRNKRPEVKAAEPIGGAAVNMNFSIVPQVYAEEQQRVGIPIVINGQLYGYADPDVEAFKLLGKPAVLIHDKSSGAIVIVEAPDLSKDSFKQYKK